MYICLNMFFDFNYIPHNWKMTIIYDLLYFFAVEILKISKLKKENTVNNVFYLF